LYFAYIEDVFYYSKYRGGKIIPPRLFFIGAQQLSFE
jgi:hypothetical protein